MSILEELAATSRARARCDARAAPLADLRRLVARLPAAPRFEAAVRYAQRLAIVAEVKRASPSAGRFQRIGAGPEAVAALARAYAAAGASGVSILTEPTRFGGSDDDLTESRGTVPLLRKDFTVDRYAVWQARALGAGAVLLIARILPGDRLPPLIAAAGEAGIDALVEVHDEAELERALAADATLIGVNARDLRSLAVDLVPTLALISRAREAGATVVAESGLETAHDLAAAADAGAHGVLIGTALLRADNPARRLAELVAGAPARESMVVVPAQPSRARVKVCGIREESTARAAGRADADFAGFVIDPASRRAISAEHVGELAPLVGRATPVLVFRAPLASDVRAAIKASGVASVQLAGFEAPPPWLDEITPRLSELIGVVHQPAAARQALQAAEAWYAAGATRVLLEGAPAAAGGGAGRDAPLAVARRVGRIAPVGLAGGLTPANVARAVARSRPAYVDASGGIEREGRGDPTRLTAFVRAARRDPSGADRVDRRGRFGRFGGRFVPETLVPALDELAAAWNEARRDPAYRAELVRLQRDFIGRPTPLFEVPSSAFGEGASGPRLFLKREDLAHTGAHKINNAVGQALLARRMGKARVIAETGAGQHGVATAAACALLGLECIVFMGSTDIDRQAPNVRRMHLLGAEVRPVTTGNGTLRDALNAALREWVASVETTYYVLGSAAGPYPYPELVADLQSVVGHEARRQIVEVTGRLPDLAIACVGGGSNAIGLFRPFLDTAVRLLAVEAGGRGDGLGDNAASLGLGRPGVLHGAFTMLTQTTDGQVVEPHSVSAGLDYPGVGPQLAALAESGRLEVTRATDNEALDALGWLSRCAGILPALEPAHALAAARRLLPDLGPDAIVLVNLSGRGDKDLDIVARESPGRVSTVTALR